METHDCFTELLMHKAWEHTTLTLQFQLDEWSKKREHLLSIPILTYEGVIKDSRPDQEENYLLFGHLDKF